MRIFDRFNKQSKVSNKAMQVTPKITNIRRLKEDKHIKKSRKPKKEHRFDEVKETKKTKEIIYNKNINAIEDTKEIEKDKDISEVNKTSNIKNQLTKIKDTIDKEVVSNKNDTDLENNNDIFIITFISFLLITVSSYCNFPFIQHYLASISPYMEQVLFNTSVSLSKIHCIGLSIPLLGFFTIDKVYNHITLNRTSMSIDNSEELSIINSILESLIVKTKSNSDASISANFLQDFEKGRKYLLNIPPVLTLNKLRQIIPVLIEKLGGKSVDIVLDSGKYILTVFDKAYEQVYKFDRAMLENIPLLHFPIGVDIYDKVFTLKLTPSSMHTLGAGSTGGGKSTLLNLLACICIYKNLPIFFIDLKNAELGIYRYYKNCKGLATDVDGGIYILNVLIATMKYRYELFSAKGCKDIESYNKLQSSLGNPEVEMLFVFIDEWVAFLEDASGASKSSLNLLLSQGRSAGIVIFTFTQFASDRLLSAAVKANLMNRIAFVCASEKTAECIMDAQHLEPYTVIPKYSDSKGIVYVKNNNIYKEIKTFYLSEDEVKAIIAEHSDTSKDKAKETKTLAKQWCQMYEKGSFHTKAKEVLQGEGIHVNLDGEITEPATPPIKNNTKRKTSRRKKNNKDDSDEEFNECEEDCDDYDEGSDTDFYESITEPPKESINIESTQRLQEHTYDKDFSTLDSTNDNVDDSPTEHDTALYTTNNGMDCKINSKSTNQNNYVDITNELDKETVSDFALYIKELSNVKEQQKTQGEALQNKVNISKLNNLK